MEKEIVNCVIEKFEEEEAYHAKLERYEKRIKKKIKKNKKLKKTIKFLEKQNEELNQKLKAVERKYKKLKKNVQYERCQLGVNPFMPLDIFGDFKKGKKKKRPQINVCCMPSWSSGASEMSKQPTVITDANFREV